MLETKLNMSQYVFTHLRQQQTVEVNAQMIVCEQKKQMFVYSQPSHKLFDVCLVIFLHKDFQT